VYDGQQASKDTPDGIFKEGVCNPGINSKKDVLGVENQGVHAPTASFWTIA
jgi:hypothetical protein